MENIRYMLSNIDINNLLKIFDIQIAIGILIVFIICRTLFSRLVIKIYYIFTKSQKNTKESVMYKPLKRFFVLLGMFIALNILPLNKQVTYIINKVFEILGIYYIFKAITTLIYEDSILLKGILRDQDNRAVNSFICKIVRALMWLIFFVICINELGFELKDLSILVTGLGIGSAVIALAAQDLVKSLISGVVILTDKPFTIGDWVELGEFQGTVVDITFRSTRIKSYNNAIITIPNSIITTEYIMNWNKLPSRRFDCVLNLSLETTSQQIKSIVKKIKVVLENNPEVIRDTVEVSLNEISSFSSDIKIFLYVRKTKYAEFLKVKQDILCDLLELVERENIDLAYPTQTLYLKKTEENGE